MRTLTKFLAVSAVLFVGGFTTSTYGGPERIDSKDKVMMAPAPVCDPRWYISIGGSVDPDLGSEFTNGNGTPGATLGVEYDPDIHGRDYDDIYHDWWNVRGEFGYVLTSHIELFGKFEYTHGESELIGGFQPGNDITFFNGLTHDLNLETRFGDYDSFGGEVGIRYFFLSKEAKVRPYVSVSGGATWVEAIGLRVDSELFGDEFTVYNGGFYDDTIVPTVSGLLGVEFNVTCHLSVGLDAGIKWTGELDQDDSHFTTTSINLGGTAVMSSSPESSREAQITRQILSTLNNAGGDRLSFPVTVYAKWRF